MLLKWGNTESRSDSMKCGNCKLWHTQTLYDGTKEIKCSYKYSGKVLGACTYRGYFYPRFNYEKCPFVK